MNLMEILLKILETAIALVLTFIGFVLYTASSLPIIKELI